MSGHEEDKEAKYHSLILNTKDTRGWCGRDIRGNDDGPVTAIERQQGLQGSRDDGVIRRDELETRIFHQRLIECAVFLVVGTIQRNDDAP